MGIAGVLPFALDLARRKSHREKLWPSRRPDDLTRRVALAWKLEQPKQETVAKDQIKRLMELDPTGSQSGIPKVNVSVRCGSTMLTTARGLANAFLLARLIQDALNEPLYDASLGGLSCTSSADEF
ncbi:hypothetical protein Daus18300_014340 [Diaporthe australafricana]|uniref:Uncharacterized protein n=1 Tax=Diaporthe australafricana TaxID=127596 RepID=A0ABR3VVN2_9PEZI